MAEVTDNVILIRKLRKDGSIDQSHLEYAASRLQNGCDVIMPVDGHYGAVSVFQGSIDKTQPCDYEHGDCCLIPSFKMIFDLAYLDKFRYDFLRRVWPGEIIVFLASNNKDTGLKTALRIPRSRYMLQLLEMVGKPLAFRQLIMKGKRVYREKQIIEEFSSSVDVVVIIREACKNHPMPTIIDLSEGDLQILAEGKLPDEEIKSLYFLGQDDVF